MQTKFPCNDIDQVINGEIYPSMSTLGRWWGEFTKISTLKEHDGWREVDKKYFYRFLIYKNNLFSETFRLCAYAIHNFSAAQVRSAAHNIYIVCGEWLSGQPGTRFFFSNKLASLRLKYSLWVRWWRNAVDVLQIIWVSHFLFLFSVHYEGPIYPSYQAAVQCAWTKK